MTAQNADVLAPDDDDERALEIDAETLREAGLGRVTVFELIVYPGKIVVQRARES